MPRSRCSASLADSLLVEGNGPVRSLPVQSEGTYGARTQSSKNTRVTNPISSPKGELLHGKMAAPMIGIGTAVLVLIAGVCTWVIFYRRRKRRGSFSPHGQSVRPVPSLVALNLSVKTFTFEELHLATDGFADLNLLGEGGFGFVHRGVLPSGKVVAIKQLKVGSKQGEREFQAEVETISRVHHRNLITLIGHCISGAQRILVCEFAPNGTLEFHLHGKDRPTLTWPMRVKIAIGTSRGLAYLHEECNPRIIHRDIKSSNILLDDNFETKVADFGLAKFASDTHTHVSTGVKGTFGYLDPDYFQSGKLTDKSDVYSFGVLLLEIVSSRRPIDNSRPSDEEAIVCWAKPLLKNGESDALVDPNLSNYDSEEMSRMLSCAAACIRPSAQHRPSMTQVLRLLEGNLSIADFNEGGRGWEISENDSSEYDSGRYEDALENEATSEFRRPKSEHDDQPPRLKLQ